MKSKVINLYFSLFFTNHLNERIKLDNFIVDIEDGILEISNKKIYNTLTFVTNKIYYHPDIVGDLVERIEVIYKIDNSEEIVEKFVIDGIDYLQDGNIKVYAKSKTIKYSYKYTKNLNRVIKADSIKSLISSLLPDVEIDFSKFSDIPLIMDYKIENKSIEDSIDEISKITDFDYYFYRGKLYIEDKKRIEKEDKFIAKFKEDIDIINFSTSSNKNDEKINRVLINTKKEDDIIATPSILLDINPSPQCCSPDSVLIFTDDDGNKYKITPMNAYFFVYYSPLINKPSINLEVKELEKVLIEEFELNNDEFVVLTGGIKEIIAVDGVEDYTYETGFNVLAFDKVEKGHLKVAYKTDVLYGAIAHSKYPKNVNINIKHFNQEINYTHKIELNGYYPIPYKLKINLLKDWGIDYQEAIGGSVNVTKQNKNIAILKVNDFAEAEFNITEYGTYKFEMANQEPLYLDYYINKKRFFMDEIKKE